ncbi:MAG: AAA family ATPase [Sediminibacterium sp.]
MNTILASALQRIRAIVCAIVNRSAAISGDDLFYDNYIEVKSFYVKRYGSIPSVLFINNMNTSEVLQYVLSEAAGKVMQVYQRSYYNWKDQKQEFSLSIIELEGAMLIELGRDYAEILFQQEAKLRAESILESIIGFRLEKKEGQHQIYIINSTSYGLDLKPLNIQPSELDLNLYYNDDFIEVDAKIQERLLKEQDKGIVLLHGLPGTGKTTYLRYLIGKVKKKVLFLSPSVAGNLMNPDVMDLLIEHPNSILVIEDAENIILDRTYQSNHSVSNLLNLSDGLLSDCLNVQIICTFNSALHLVDPALLRKGRLIAQYEFGKLSVDKAQKLAGKLNIETSIDAPVTLAELLNPASTNYEPKKTQVMGFRRVLATN